MRPISVSFLLAGLLLAVVVSRLEAQSFSLGDTPAWNAQESTTDPPSSQEIPALSDSFMAGSSESYLFTDTNLFGDPEILWPGFLTGMRATTRMHERCAEPVGSPIYFESPFIDT